MSRFAKAVLAAAFFLGASAALHSQELNPSFKAMIDAEPLRAGINTCPYDLMYTPQTYSKAPRGYRPFYISHYGRHGARSNWDLKVYTEMEGILAKAEEQGTLTSKGKTLLETVRKEILLHDEMDGRLTPRGVREHRGIAERMYRNYRKVFKGEKQKVRAISSVVPRCIVSMTGFTDRLTELAPSLDISWDTGEKYMKYLDSGSPKEVSQKVWRISDSLVYRNHVCDSLFYADELFTSREAAFRTVPSWRWFERGIYAVARITGSFDLPGIFDLMPRQAIYDFCAADNLGLYLNHCNSIEFGQQRMARSRPGVEDFVRKADAVISGQDVVQADLRFGHDLPFLAMTSNMGIEGVGQRLRAEDVCDKWFGTLYTPFATNLQIVFYRTSRASDPVLVKFLLDERETGIIGLEPFSGRYYRWEDVKRKWGF